MKRKLLRCHIVLLLGLLGILFLAAPAYADATITVTTTADGVVDDGDCSLREAVLSANADSAVGGCTTGNGADVIVFDAALSHPVVFALTEHGANEDGAQMGDLDISSVLTIRGDASSADAIVIDGDGADRVFHVLSGANLTLDSVTVRNGNPGVTADGGGALVELSARLTVSGTRIVDNRGLSGGGVKSLGRLTMTDSVVVTNQGGGLANDAGLMTLTRTDVLTNTGVGILNQNIGGLTVDGGQVRANTGGGVRNDTSTATLRNLTIAGNSNGGVYNAGTVLTRLTLQDSLVISNTGTNGAGVYNEGVGASADIDDVRFSGNQATVSGGAIFNNGVMNVDGSALDNNQARAGGGILHNGGNLYLTNDTISANQASDNGGGLYNKSSAIVQNVTFAGNRASTGGNIFNDEAQLSMGDAIVANAAAGGECVNSAGFLTSQGYNLESANTCNFTATGDQINADPLLGPLQDNGGPTPTHALLTGSPAIDGGSLANCPPIDQRGVSRPQGSACDIGAYESGDVGDVTPPGPVPGLRATLVSTDSITIEWDAATDDTSVAGYKVYVQEDGSAQPPALKGDSCDSCLVFSVIGLQPDTLYRLWAVAYDQAGNAADLADLTPIQVTTLALTPPVSGQIRIDISPPAPSASDVVTVTISGIHSDTCTPGYASHQVAGHAIAVQSAPSSEAFCSPAETPWSYDVAVGPLEAGLYTVTHTLETAVISRTFTVTATTPPPDVTPPGPVVNLTATAVSTDSITIEWDAATDDTGVAGYRVYVQEDGSAQPPALAGQTGAGQRTFTAGGLKADMVYRLWVVAYDAAGNAADLADLTPIQASTLGVGRMQIDISPPSPTITDVVTVTISGVYMDSCTPGYASHQVTGHRIDIQSAPSSEAFCSPVETPWSYDVAVGPLEAGVYTVTHTLETDVISKTFTVAEKAAPCAPKFEVDESQSRTAISGQPFTYQVTAAGTPPIVYSLQQGPAGMTVDVASGLVSWTPPAGASGDVPVVVRAANSAGENDYAFTIAVRTAADLEQHNYLPLILGG